MEWAGSSGYSRKKYLYLAPASGPYLYLVAGPKPYGRQRRRGRRYARRPGCSHQARVLLRGVRRPQLSNAKLQSGLTQRCNLLVFLPEVRELIRDAKPRTNTKRVFLFGLDESQALVGCKMRLSCPAFDLNFRTS